MNKKVTITDIARVVGVTHPVVSAVLGNRKSTIKFSEATRKRILKAAEEMNYKPNILARSFKTQKSYLIGVLFSGVNQVIASDFLYGLQKTLSSSGYSPITFIHNNCDEELEYLERCMDREVEGLIVNPAIDEQGKSNGAKLSRIASSVPMVEVFGNEASNVPSFNMDYHSASLKATQQLIAEGHKKIAVYAHDRYIKHKEHPGLHFLAWQYMQGYHQAIQESGLKDIVIEHPIIGNLEVPNASFLGAYQDAFKVLDHPEKPTAVMCLSHDELDAIVMAMVASGRSLPKNFHLISQGNPSYSKAGQCKISMLVPPIQEIGKKAATSIFEIINGKEIDSMDFALKLTI
jgi:DNA-binding LacI/PurR family transcriptional regulator